MKVQKLLLLLVIVASLALLSACGATYAKRNAADPIMAITDVAIQSDAQIAPKATIVQKKLLGEMMSSGWFVKRDDGVAVTGTLTKTGLRYDLSLSATDKVSNMTVSTSVNSDTFDGTEDKKLDTIVVAAVNDLTKQLKAQADNKDRPVVTTISSDAPVKPETKEQKKQTVTKDETKK